jgi:hypothetical protein
MTFWIADWLRMFALTLAVELAVATPLLRRAEPRLWRRMAGISIANLASHPVVWFVMPGAALAYATRIVLSETWAFGAEVLVYLVIWPALGWRRAVLVSLSANVASVAVGQILRALPQ